MATPFLGEVKLSAFNFPPKGWAQCNGQLLPINQNTALFSILGTTYGGNGITTFALPDLQGRAPLGVGQGPGLQNYVEGLSSGNETIALTAAQGVAHTHTVMVSPAAATATTPASNLLAVTATAAYSTSTSNTTMSGAEVSSVGGQPHTNVQPCLVIAYCIALQGIFPSRN